MFYNSWQKTALKGYFDQPIFLSNPLKTYALSTSPSQPRKTSGSHWHVYQLTWQALPSHIPNRKYLLVAWKPKSHKFKLSLCLFHSFSFNNQQQNYEWNIATGLLIDWVQNWVCFQGQAMSQKNPVWVLYARPLARSLCFVGCVRKGIKFCQTACSEPWQDAKRWI